MSSWMRAAFGLGALAGALTVGALVPRRLSRSDAGGRNDVYLDLMNAAHVDIALPATPEVRRRLAFLQDVGIRTDHPEMSHILVGWGGRDFYPDTYRPWRISPMGLLESVFGDESVLRFDPAADLGGPWKTRRRIPLSDQGLSALIDFVLGMLERNPDGLFRPLNHFGINDTDHFYKARPTFTVFADCNVWASRALAAAGVPSGIWTPLPQSLIASLWWHHWTRRESTDPSNTNMGND